MDLKQEIRKLIELQELDSKIYTLTQEKDITKPAQLDELRNNFQAKKEALSSYEEKVKQLQLKKKEQELDLASKEENVRKAQGQLYQLKTNKEYHAKLSGIESLKADVSVIEEVILNMLEELDKAEQDLEEVAKTKPELKAALDQWGIFERPSTPWGYSAAEFRPKKINRV